MSMDPNKIIFKTSIWGMSIFMYMMGVEAGNARAEAILLGNDGAWESSTEKAGKKQVCFMASEPVKRTGKVKGRGRSYLMVAHRPQEKSLNVVSYRAGYDFKAYSDAKVVVGKKTFKMFTDNGYAFAYDSKTDAALVKAMIRGATLKITGLTKNGKKMTDTYSLKGFSAAFKRISKACKV